MTPPLGPVTPLFISADVPRALAFYTTQLGFEIASQYPDDAPFFALLRRGEAQIMLKHIADDITPKPNATRHPWARWDAFILTPDPEALRAEVADAGAQAEPAGKTDDGLFGFEVTDADGYTLFFGHPA